MFKQWWADYKRLSQSDARWVTIWMIIYLSFLVLDIFFPESSGTSMIKYIGILLCIIYAASKYKKDTLLIMAIILTFAADTILVWTTAEILGVVLFCAAQLMHIIRQNKIKATTFAMFATIATVSLIAGNFLGIELIYIISSIYAILLCTNLYLAIKRYELDKKHFPARCGFYGFVLFICCDINVAARHLVLDGVFPIVLYPLVSYLVWFFYYPSQVLLANSSTTKPTRFRALQKKRA